jgi:hypothetical protein
MVRTEPFDLVPPFPYSSSPKTPSMTRLGRGLRQLMMNDA